eukprot:PhM_4_TR18689/c1_g1_i11/m.46261
MKRRHQLNKRKSQKKAESNSLSQIFDHHQLALLHFTGFEQCSQSACLRVVGTSARRHVRSEARRGLVDVAGEVRLHGSTELSVPVTAVVLQLVHPLLVGRRTRRHKLVDAEGAALSVARVELGGQHDLVQQTHVEAVHGLFLHHAVHKRMGPVALVEALHDAGERSAGADVRVLLHALAAHVARARLARRNARRDLDAVAVLLPPSGGLEGAGEMLRQRRHGGVGSVARAGAVRRNTRNGVPRGEEAVAQEHVGGAAVLPHDLHHPPHVLRVEGDRLGRLLVHACVEAADVDDDDAHAALLDQVLQWVNRVCSTALSPTPVFGQLRRLRGT